MQELEQQTKKNQRSRGFLHLSIREKIFGGYSPERERERGFGPKCLSKNFQTLPACHKIITDFFLRLDDLWERFWSWRKIFFFHLHAGEIEERLQD